MWDDRCRQCKTVYREQQHPRYLTTQRDRDRCRAAGYPITERGTVVWIARFSCDCDWRARLRYVHTELLSLLLPDPTVQQEIRRRGVPVGGKTTAAVDRVAPEAM
jgi:hypothetical protein